MNRVRGRLARTVLLLVVGALTLTGCDFSVYSLPLPGGASLGSDPYTVKVEFRDVLDLVPQSTVKVDDVTVGKVDKIQAVGYHALVTLRLKKSVKLPDNAVATIRQTSLLGEKFVSLAPPATGASSGRLGNGDLIPLDRSGRNPEVEEVLGALSLLLNGGGVAQLKTISVELNDALGGRESDVRSLLAQLKVFTGQLDTNKDQIVRAIESLNRLAVALNKQRPAITSALDYLPRAVASINRQRDDLVKMLRALADLSSVGTRVIAQSKTATVDSLRALAPTLTKLSEAGNALPKALQVFLTYPFVDAVVGKNAAQARNLHMGDYTNLSVQLDLNLNNGLPQLPVDPTQVCQYVPQVGKRLCGDALKSVLACLSKLANGKPGACTAGILSAVCKNVPKQFPDLCGQVGPTGPVLSQMDKCVKSMDPTSPACRNVGNLKKQCATAKYRNTLTCRLYNAPTGGVLGGATGGGGGLLGGTTGGGGGILPRPGFATGAAGSSGSAGSAQADTGLGALLVWGMVQR